MSAVVAAGALLLCVAVVHLVAHFGQRLSPTFALPATGPRWLFAGLVLGAVAGVSGLALETPWLEVASDPLDIASSGSAGALAAGALTLAALVLLTTLLQLVLPRRRAESSPVSPFSLVFGVAADGSALEAVRRPIRWGANGLSLAVIASLPWTADAIDPTGWALGLSMLVAVARAFSPAPSPASPVAKEAPSVAASDDPQADFHRALGSPPLFEREAAIAGAPEGFAAHCLGEIDDERARAPEDGILIAIQAPPGAGKRRAARTWSESLAESGLTTLWLEDLPPLLDALANGESFARLGAVVVTPGLARSGESLASLRYAIHRLRARARRPVHVLVLGETDSVVTVARAIGAAEPRVVRPAEPLPTRPILRYLLPAPPPPALAASAPDGVLLAALDRPLVNRRYPALRASAREYLVPAGGPRGRRMREDRARSLTGGQAPRLLAALPGDRDAPLTRDALARFHLRSALAETPQDPVRLRRVFSPALVDHELAALAKSNLLVELPSWRAESTAAAGIVSAPRISARLPRAALEPAPRVALVEPRAGHQLVVSAGVLELEYYDGAICTLEPGPGAPRYEVRHSGSGPILVPCGLAAATPLRTLQIEVEDALTRARLRFRGARDLEVWEGALRVRALHYGVKQFQRGGDGPEARATTRLLPEPRPLPSLATAGRLILFGDVGAAAMHAIVHAVREVVPLLVENAGDLGVTWAGPGDVVPGLGDRLALVLYDAHPDGLGTTADLRDDDLDQLISAACGLLECDCAAHCARCCESLSCTSPVAPDAALSAPDRRLALRILSEVVTPRPIPFGVQARHQRLRRSA